MLKIEVRDEFDCFSWFIEYGNFVVYKNKLDKQNIDKWLILD